jgi:penicillin amidase
MRRFVLMALAVVCGLLVLTAAAVYSLARRSLPALSGTIAVDGVSGPIDIVRDADAIPHIFASTKTDALFGLGYVHAQDRLWQMEFQRRIGNGRLSEVFGATTVPQDRFLRTVGFGRAARTAWQRLPPFARTQIDAYVAGINAFITTHHGSALPPEFSLLRFEPERFTGPDVLVWVKMMAWDLSGNYTFELLRHDLIARVGASRAAALMPPYPRDGLSILPAVEPALLGGAHHTANAATRAEPNSTDATATALFTRAVSHGAPAVAAFLLGSAAGEAIGSNNWVVDGTRSATGKPILANDPHLGTRLPSTWYLAEMSAGDFDVIGATLPGAPAVALGRNRRIAWGATNVAADVEDLYREHIDPSGRFAEFRGAQEPVSTVTETIKVKGAAPVRVDVRFTRHGPIVTDAVNAINDALPAAERMPTREALAFRWTALDPDDTTVASFLKLNAASSWAEFTDALRDFVVPSQNFVYADVDGHIGYYAPGRIPIRASGDGASPADGWTGAAEWTGWVPFDALPHAYDPPSHVIVTANNRPEPDGYPYLLGLEWAEPYRAQRIVDRLREKPKLSVDDSVAIQADTVSLQARALLPSMLGRLRPPAQIDARDREAVERLKTWDGDARRDSAAAAVFEAWSLRLAPAIAGDELGAPLLASYQGRFSFVTRFLLETLADDHAPWCDDLTTSERETCTDVVTKALHEAVADLTARMGRDMTRWRWDAVHHAVFPHQGLDAVAALRPLLSRSMPTGGDWSTIDVGSVSTDHLYEQRSVPGYREVIDLSPANDSRFLIDVGESGHPLSPHYDDFLKDWQAVTLRKMRMNRSDVEQGAIGHVRLTPKAGRP